MANPNRYAKTTNLDNEGQSPSQSRNQVGNNSKRNTEANSSRNVADLLFEELSEVTNDFGPESSARRHKLENENKRINIDLNPERTSIASNAPVQRS